MDRQIQGSKRLRRKRESWYKTNLANFHINLLGASGTHSSHTPNERVHRATCAERYSSPGEFFFSVFSTVFDTDAGEMANFCGVLYMATERQNANTHIIDVIFFCFSTQCYTSFITTSYQWFCSKHSFSSSCFVIMLNLRRNQRRPARLQLPRVRGRHRHHHRRHHRHLRWRLRLRRVRIRRHLRRSKHSKTTLPSFLSLIWNLIIRRYNMWMRIPSKHPRQQRLINEMILFKVRRCNIFIYLPYSPLNHWLRSYNAKKYVLSEFFTIHRKACVVLLLST